MKLDLEIPIAVLLTIFLRRDARIVPMKLFMNAPEYCKHLGIGLSQNVLDAERER
jgi:hypothetical protein